MATRFRPFLLGVLCCMAALGHAPAWLHVSSCNEAICASAADQRQPRITDSCGHSCAHHHHGREASGDANHEGIPADGRHDHDTCSICQSLCASGGVTWKLGVSLGILSTQRPLATLPQRTLIATFQLAAAPRGPPAMA